MRRVLVLINERHIARRIEANMERQGYRVDFAIDGGDLYEQATTNRPDLIV